MFLPLRVRIVEASFGAQHFLNGIFQRIGRLRDAGRVLRVAPVVEDANLMHALQCARRRAPLFGAVFALEIFHRVLFERRAGIAALL